MKTLRKLRITGGLLLPGTRFPAAVGDQVKLFLDTDAIPEFPEYLIGVIQNPIVTSDCGSVTEYNIQYDEIALDGSAEFIRPVDVIETVLVNQIDVLSIGLDNEIAARIADVNAEEARATADVNSEEARAIAAETVLQTNITNEVNARIADVNAEEARAIAAEALLAPKASPTFTGAPLAPTAAVDTATTQLATTAFVVNQAYAKLASPALTGTPTAPTAAPGTATTQLATTNFVTTADNLKAPLDSPVLTGVPVAPTATYSDSSTQLATTAFVKSLIANGFAATPQSLTGAGAVDVVSLSTLLTSTGAAQALTLANGQPGQVKTIIHAVDGGSMILTPTTKTGFSTITFTNVGETATLQFFTTIGWVILALRNAVAA